MNEKIYLAGKITGDPGYKEKFSAAEKTLRGAGYRVLTTTALPASLDYEDYFVIGYAMIDVCDSVCFLPGYRESPGATRELMYAVCKKKQIRFFEDMEDECYGRI